MNHRKSLFHKNLMRMKTGTIVLQYYTAVDHTVAL